PTRFILGTAPGVGTSPSDRLARTNGFLQPDNWIMGGRGSCRAATSGGPASCCAPPRERRPPDVFSSYKNVGPDSVADRPGQIRRRRYSSAAGDTCRPKCSSDTLDDSPPIPPVLDTDR